MQQWGSEITRPVQMAKISRPTPYGILQNLHNALNSTQIYIILGMHIPGTNMMAQEQYQTYILSSFQEIYSCHPRCKLASSKMHKVCIWDDAG